VNTDNPLPIIPRTDETGLRTINPTALSKANVVFLLFVFPLYHSFVPSLWSLLVFHWYICLWEPSKWVIILFESQFWSPFRSHILRKTISYTKAPTFGEKRPPISPTNVRAHGCGAKNGAVNTPPDGAK
jgi:hypothetical protein